MFDVATQKSRRAQPAGRTQNPLQVSPEAGRYAFHLAVATTGLGDAQRKDTPCPGPGPGACADILGHGVQAKLEVGPVDDPFEREADRVSEQVMRKPAPDEEEAQVVGHGAPRVERMCAECEDELVHRKPISATITPVAQRATDRDHDGESGRRTPEGSGGAYADGSGTGDASDGESSQIDLDGQIAGLGAGDELPGSARAYLEPRFGYDFGHVRVHTGSRAAESADSIHALAYTAGNRIVFNRGQFSPDTPAGMRLLAHELTHVVQQNPGVGRKPSDPGESTSEPGRRDATPAVSSGTASARSAVQRKPFFFAPSVGKPKGTLVHSQVLPLFLENNDNLFIEAPIPGADRADPDTGKKGRADFYTATATGGESRTIGLSFDGEPAYLSGPGVKWSGGKYGHKGKAAPLGSDSTPHAKKLDVAPTQIGIGELKPGFSSESFLGSGQVSHYKTGITNTASALASYLKANPQEGSPGGRSWKPTPTTLESLTIPPKMVYPTGTHFPLVPLGLYEDRLLGVGRVLEDAGLTGRLFVYKDDTSGVWSYEWMPQSIPAATGSGLVNTVLDRLNKKVIPAITADTGPGAKRKRKPGPPPTRSPRNGIVQRKFSNAQWKLNEYSPWDKDAKAFLGDDKEVGKARVAETAVELQERSGQNLGIPKEVSDRGKGLSRIQHWHRFGGLYGWLREKFDFVIVKFQKLATWVKTKVKKLTKSAAGVKFGNWVKAAAQAIFKIFKMVGAWAVRETAEKLVDSLQRGVSANLKKLVDMATPEGVKSKIEEFEEQKAKYEEILAQQEEALTKYFFGDHLELFEQLAKFEEVANKASTIVALVEWGVRLLACASPPAIGCLWNLAISALQAAFALLMQTCWFTKKVYQPVISNVDLVRSFPSKLAASLVAVGNDYIPMPEGFDPLFAPIELNVTDFKADCDEGSDGGARLTPERRAILDLLDEVGEEKFRAFLEMTSKRAAGPWVLMTPERISALKTPLKTTEVETLQDLASDPSKGAPVGLEEFLTGISKYTKKEKAVAKAYHEQAAKAAAEKAAAGKGHESAPSGSDGGKAKGGAAAAAEGVIVLNGADHPIVGTIEKSRPTPGIHARVVGASTEHKSSPPKAVTVDIYVNGVHRYRVNEVKVRSIFGGETLVAGPRNLFMLVYYLEPGLMLDIDGERVFWEQLQWSKWADE